MQRIAVSQTRMLVCRATLRQPIGHLGKEITIFGFHGHYMTMKITWQTEYTRIWDKTAALIRDHNVQIFAGDFNMGMLHVPKELSCRGLKCDCIAYYPWAMGRGVPATNFPHRLGLDSMAFFYIGGEVEARVNWPLSHIERLKSAGKSNVVSDWGVDLDTYEAQGKWPGQPWQCFKCKRTVKESATDKDLAKSLKEFLTPTTPTDELAARTGPNGEIRWLRFRQKPSDKKAFLVNGTVHQGAHISLLVFTSNPQSHRTRDGAKARNKKDPWPKTAPYAMKSAAASSSWSQVPVTWCDNDSYVVESYEASQHRQWNWSGAQNNSWASNQWGSNQWSSEPW